MNLTNSWKWRIGLLVLCGLLFVSGCAKPKQRIILLTNGDSPFWDACRVGMEEAAKDLGTEEAGYEVVMEANNGTIAGQLEKLRQFSGESDIAAIAVSAIVQNNKNVAEELRKLRKQGVKIITVDSDVDRETASDARFAFIGTDNLEGGKTLGLCGKELVPDGGKYICFVGLADAQNAIERIDGFGIGAGEEFEKLDVMPDDMKRDVARDNVRNALQNHPDANLYVGIWSYNAPAIAEIIDEADKTGDLTVVVFDAEPKAIEHMAAGRIDAMVVQDPYQMGYQSVRLLKALIEDDQETIDEMFPNHGKQGGDIYETGLKVVVPSEDSPLNAEMFSEGVEFYTLEEFRKWLDDHDLTGS